MCIRFCTGLSVRCTSLNDWYNLYCQVCKLQTYTRMLELLEIILLFVIQTGMTSFCMYFIALYSFPIFTYNVPTCNFSSTICYTCIHYTEMSFFVEMLSTCLEKTFLPLFYFVNVKSVKGVPFFVKLGALLRSLVGGDCSLEETIHFQFLS